jgi:hypothetical protein
MKTIKGDLVLTKDTTFEESIAVEGNITCKGGRFNLEVNGNIDARNIIAWNISAGDIDAWNIDAWNIDARNISAGNISAGDIDAGNIIARNIIAWNISAGDISYYAFCISYTSIKCTSIEGRREHSLHKALDGKITR